MNTAESLFDAIKSARAANRSSVESSCDLAAISIAGLIADRVRAFPAYFHAAFYPGSSTYYTVRGGDAVGKDIAARLATVLNKGVTEPEGVISAATIIIFGTARTGTYLKAQVAAENRTGVPCAGFAIFVKDEAHRNEPWVLMQKVSPVDMKDALAAVDAVETAMAAEQAAMAEETEGREASSVKEMLARLLGQSLTPEEASFMESIGDLGEKMEKAGGCDGCMTGLFSTTTKSTYMTFCPSNSLGQVLSNAAQYLGAMGSEPISISPVDPEAVPGDVVVNSMKD